MLFYASEAYSIRYIHPRLDFIFEIKSRCTYNVYYMLPKNKKASRQTIARIEPSSRNYYSVFMTLRITKTSPKKARFACVVSKKVAVKATDRNTLRRRCYTVLEHFYKEIHPNMTGIWYLKKNAIKISYTTLQKEMHTLLRKSGALS